MFSAIFRIQNLRTVVPKYGTLVIHFSVTNLKIVNGST